MHIVYTPVLLRPDEKRIIAAAIDWHRQEAKGALGFFPRTGIDQQINADRCLVLYDTDDPEDLDPVGGWMLWCRNRNVARILGISVPEDFRLQGRGRSLCEALTRHPAMKKVDTIQLRCAVDLDSNHFWTALGWELIEAVAGNNKTGRMINLYRRPKIQELKLACESASSST